MLIEEKIKEYIKYDGSLDLWDNIPLGCKLSIDDFNQISELLADTLLYKRKLQSKEMDVKFKNKINALYSKLNTDELIDLIVSLEEIEKKK